mgnify:CR=1 FL=1
MNKPNKIIIREKQRSRESRRLLIQYFVSFIAYIIGFVVFIIMAWNFCNLLGWQPENLLYRFLKFVENYFPLFGGITFLSGWVIITYYFISKPLRYLDEVVAATEQLIIPSDEPIVLSSAMYYTETELNRVREKALENIRTAKEAEQRKNDLVMYLAHDLKTPLSSVIGYLTLLRDEQQISDELRERYLSITLDKAERLEDLINEFFEIARFNLSGMTLEYSTVNLTRMLEQITYEFKPMFLDKDLSCELSAAPNLTIKCDVDKMQRVLDNLLRNAINYSYENTIIKVEAEEISGNVCIRVINEGNTIPEEKLERIFEQFFRLDTARSSSTGGPGLGLAIAKEIIELHNGKISANSTDGITCFELIIPLS